jgi:UDP-N-acetylglucosamine--N-acetylmuramyl-(pentapeptide) pyrophosphoryl-undecaprenol N-acetylglucosamine transferase
MTYVIAGGGTGGHVFPAIAVADALRQIDPNSEIVFIGTARGLEDTAVPKAGYKLERIVVSGIKGRAVFNKVRALFQLPLAIWHCMRLLRQYKAKAVLGVGGYASGPAVIAAVLLRIPVGLCEPNSVPGLTNKVIGRFAKRVFTAFKSTSAYFKASKIRLVGNALRNKLTLAAPKGEVGLPFKILVVGGSQGARALNLSLPPCFAALRDKGFAVTVRHQTGSSEVKSTQELYQQLNLDAKVDAFIDNMAEAYAWADLLVCRSGATTCSEVLAVGPVAIYVPLPTAIYDHQMLNAKELAQEGACLVVSQGEITPPTLANTMAELLSDQNGINSMINSARSLAKPNASVEIAQSFLNRFSVGIVILCGTHFFTAV